MSVETNKATVRRFVEEVQNQGDMDAADELITPDAINHSAPPGVSPDREGVKQLTAAFLSAFPDGRMTLDDMVAEGDKVASRKTFRGTHSGEFMGMPPTGRRVTVSVIDIVRLADGRVVEHWGVSDALGMLQQLGAIPGQPEPAG